MLLWNHARIFKEATIFLGKYGRISAFCTNKQTTVRIFPVPFLVRLTWRFKLLRRNILYDVIIYYLKKKKKMNKDFVKRQILTWSSVVRILVPSFLQRGYWPIFLAITPVLFIPGCHWTGGSSSDFIRDDLDWSNVSTPLISAEGPYRSYRTSFTNDVFSGVMSSSWT